MNLASCAQNRMRRLGRAFLDRFYQYTMSNSPAPSEEPVVFAVTNRYPTRIVLYAAAFQGRWKVRFMKSLRHALDAAHSALPKAIFYDHTVGDPSWNRYCASFSHDGVPFVLLANKDRDQTFLDVLAAGGFHAWGDPLTSEEVVEAVRFAGELAGLAHVPAI